MPRPEKMSTIFPTPKTRRPAATSRSSQVSPVGSTVKSRRLAVRRKLPGLPDEGPRDDAPDAVLTRQDAPREAAEVPELLGRPDVLVARRPGRPSLRTCRGSAGRSPGARRRAPPGSPFPTPARLPRTFLPASRSKGATTSGGKPLGIERERPLDDEPHHLPVAGRRVLAGRELRHLSRARPSAAPRADEREQAQALEIRERRRMPLENVAERVAARVAVAPRRRAPPRRRGRRRPR